VADLVEVPFDGGTITFAAIGSTGPQGFSADASIGKAADSLDAALRVVRELGTAMANQLRGLEVAGAEATFGISFTGKGKFIVAEASAAASLTFKLTFRSIANSQ
jgi:hypothetical protein